MKQRGQKVKNGAGRPSMASVMGICGSLVGPKSGNVENILVFKGFLKGQGSPEDPSRANDQASRTCFWWKKPQKTSKKKKDEPLDMKWKV